MKAIELHKKQEGSVLNGIGYMAALERGGAVPPEVSYVLCRMFAREGIGSAGAAVNALSREYAPPPDAEEKSPLQAITDGLAGIWTRFATGAVAPTNAETQCEAGLRAAVQSELQNGVRLNVYAGCARQWYTMPSKIMSVLKKDRGNIGSVVTVRFLDLYEGTTGPAKFHVYSNHESDLAEALYASAVKVYPNSVMSMQRGTTRRSRTFSWYLPSDAGDCRSSRVKKRRKR